MGRSQETFNKKAVRNKKEKKRKDKEQKRAMKKSEGKKSTYDDMIAYVDEFGVLSSEPPDPTRKTDVDAESIDLSMTRKDSNEDQNSNRIGVITYFNLSKGYGFVVEKETGQRVFVHTTGLMEPVNENDVVVFDIARGPKGLSAINVRVSKE